MNISSTSSENLNSDQEVLVKVDNVGKIFCRDLKQSLLYGVKDSVRDLVGRRKNDKTSGERSLREGEFWANKGISFELRRGECLGLIGHNGAGKTTLLKMLNGLIKPDSGSIKMRGKIGAMIALGAGFNPILTGRENIYINGSVLGMRRAQIDSRINEIIDFADIGDFIDSPVQTYSSGMQVRLGFAVASSLKPDVLILDEVLAVGDIGFTIKCLNRVREIAKDCVVIFVSHNMQYVSNFCTRVMVMSDGEVLMDATDPGRGISCYYNQMKFVGSETGQGGVKLQEFRLSSEPDKIETDDPVIERGKHLSVSIDMKVEPRRDPVIIELLIADEALSSVISYPVIDQSGIEATFEAGNHNITVNLGQVDLSPGRYSFKFIASTYTKKVILVRKTAIKPFTIVSDTVSWASIIKEVRYTSHS